VQILFEPQKNVVKLKGSGQQKPLEEIIIEILKLHPTAIVSKIMRSNVNDGTYFFLCTLTAKSENTGKFNFKSED
jgi:hypothetical protein